MLELRDIYASLTVKFDDSVRELTSKLQACENLPANKCTRFDKLATAQAAVATQFANTSGKSGN